MGLAANGKTQLAVLRAELSSAALSRNFWFGGTDGVLPISQRFFEIRHPLIQLHKSIPHEPAEDAHRGEEVPLAARAFRAEKGEVEADSHKQQ
jgi:hypothetical protein